jgi:hypothetical protein
MKSPAMVVMVALIACGSCQYDPHTHLYTTRKPSQQALVGRYELKRQTVSGDGLSALGGKLPAVELFADGSFTATRVPPRGPQTAASDREFWGELLNASGRWRVGSVGGIDNGFGREETHWGVYLDAETTPVDAAGLTGTKPPYGLIFKVGDPDSGEAMFLERQN